MSGMNPNATTAVRLGPGLLGRRGYAQALTDRANVAGHIGLGKALRQKVASVANDLIEPEVPETLTPEQAIAAQLASDPSAWEAVLEAEADRPDGARQAVVQAVLTHAGHLIPEEIEQGLRAMFPAVG
jgi:hypothetical protein